MSRAVPAAALVIAALALGACGGDDKSNTTSTPSGIEPGNGKVTVVYDENAKPESNAAIQALKQSGAFDPLPAWVNKTVALPHDMTIKVTDKVPPGVTDMVTQPDGRTIYVPPAFLNDIHGAAEKIVKEVKRPAFYPADKWNVDDLSALAAQFILGHEMGHALQRQLMLPNLGLEEDAADGFAQFYSINELPPTTIQAGAILFDQIARLEGKLTLEKISSDHPVTQQRVFNFLCLQDGSDPNRYDAPLVEAGYIPKSRAPLCPQEWTALNYGWWTQLKPFFRAPFKDQGDKEQAQARAEQIAETKRFAKQLDKIRAAQTQ